MKRYFAPNATEAVASAPAATEVKVAAPATELTSDNLTALKAEYVKAWAEMQKHSDPFAAETKAAKMAVWTIEGKMEAEKADLQKAANLAKIQEQRNERLKLNQSQLDLYAVLIGLRNDKKADPVKLAEAETAFITAKEAVDNELLAKFASSKPGKTAVATDGTDKTSGDSKKAEIIELALQGKTRAEIEALGFARSSVWHTTNDAIIAGQVFPNIKSSKA